MYSYYKLHDKLKFSKIYWEVFCANPHDKACYIIINHLNTYINNNEMIPIELSYGLCGNTNDIIINFISEHFDNIEMDLLCYHILFLNKNNIKLLDILFNKLYELEYKTWFFSVITKNNTKEFNKYILKNLDKLIEIFKEEKELSNFYKLLCEKNDDDIVDYLLTNFKEILSQINNNSINSCISYDFICDVSYYTDITLIYHLCKNTHDKIIQLLEKNLNKLDGKYGLTNPWRILCENTNDKAIDLISNNFHKINQYDWFYLSRNPSDRAVDLLINKSNVYNIFLSDIYINSNDKAVDLVIKNIDKCESYNLSKLSINTNMKALELYSQMLKNIDKNIIKSNSVFMEPLIKNPNPKALDILFEYFDIIIKYRYYLNIWSNPNIFRYDYEYIKTSRYDINKGIIYYHMKPNKKNLIEKIE